MISSINVTLDGVQLKKHFSTDYFKILCNEDGNIYPIAYTTKDATVSFSETSFPLNEILPGTEISASQVLGLSDFISVTVDLLDGIKDNKVNFDGGGAL